MANANPHKPALVNFKRGELGLCGFMHSARAVTSVAGIGICRYHEKLLLAISRSAVPSAGRDVRYAKRLTMERRA